MAERTIPHGETIGLNATEAAETVGVSTTLFLQLVDDGTFPKPMKLRGRKVWYRAALVAVFDRHYDMNARRGRHAPT